MIKTEQFKDQRILLIDKDSKKSNDRTWCFWEKENGFFDDIVFKKWDAISFLSETFSNDMNIQPYQYKMIRGIDFYNYCFQEIAKHQNIEIVYGAIEDWEYQYQSLTLWMDGKEFKFENTIAFNSIYKPKADKKTIKLLQHFKGFVIESDQPVFNPELATMMDFRVHQKNGTTFTYVLPFSDTIALIEYTLFTKKLLTPDQYNIELDNYIKNILGIESYQIKEEEFGVIPMTNEKLRFEKNGWNIGTAGGQTKASSGYTFQFIQKQSQQIVDYIIAGKALNSIPKLPNRFRFYDNTLLDILYHDTIPGKQIFATLFQKNAPQQVLKFLDNESSIKEELKIIASLPTWPFLKAAIKQL